MAVLTVPHAFELALQHHRAGHLAEAEALYRQILAVQPDHLDTWHNLGLALSQRAQWDEAVAALRRAIELKPDFTSAHFNLGNAFKDQGRADEAIAAYRRALELEPGSIEVLTNLGAVLDAAGRHQDAVDAYRRALAIAPGHPVIYVNLGCALTSLKEWNEAIDCFRYVISIQPTNADAYANLAQPYHEMGNSDEALACSLEALRLRPDHPFALVNAATAWERKGHFDEAESAFRAAIQRDPNHATAHTGLGMLQWLRGHYAEGWAEMEWRWQNRSAPEFQRRFSVPRWNAQSESSRPILLHCEQGFGDTIQFLRYLPLLCQRASPRQVYFEHPPELTRLLAQGWDCPETLTRHTRDITAAPLPSFAEHLPLLSIPHALRLNEPVAMTAPYLRPDATLRLRWRERLGAADGFRIGFVSAGNSTQVNNAFRSIPSSKLLPLLHVPGAHFYRLQVGTPSPDLQSLLDAGLIDLTHHITDFADTAAFMAELDLIVTTDTVTPHLAGALGLPVWTMLAFVPDWRWGLEGEVTPWYPTMRLFRQPSQGDWDSVVKRVTEELRSLSK